MKKGLGKLLYMEWLFPIKDYYCSIRQNEVLFEIIIPAIISITCSFIYYLKGKLYNALNGLAEILPTAISILIGFTIMLITLLLTSSGDNVDKLKTTMSSKKLYNKSISLYQGLHVQFLHSLFSEIFLLLIVFLYLFLSGIWLPLQLGFVMLIVETYLTLNILFSILRGVANLYFAFYKS